MGAGEVEETFEKSNRPGVPGFIFIKRTVERVEKQGLGDQERGWA